MSTFIINKGFRSEQSVEADQHQIKDGFFHFFDDDKGEVFTIAQAQVTSITREE